MTSFVWWGVRHRRALQRALSFDINASTKRNAPQNRPSTRDSDPPHHSMSVYFRISCQVCCCSLDLTLSPFNTHTHSFSGERDRDDDDLSSSAPNTDAVREIRMKALREFTANRAVQAKHTRTRNTTRQQQQQQRRRRVMMVCCVRSIGTKYESTPHRASTHYATLC